MSAQIQDTYCHYCPQINNFIDIIERIEYIFLNDVLKNNRNEYIVSNLNKYLNFFRLLELVPRRYSEMSWDKANQEDSTYI